MDPETMSVFIPISAILGGIAFGCFSLWAGVKRREMIHRERLAMIERGIALPPETQEAASHGRPRALHVGTILVGIGLRLGLLIPLASEGEAILPAVGVGGLLVILGGAFLINGFVDQSAARASDAGSGGRGPGSDVRDPGAGTANPEL